MFLIISVVASFKLDEKSMEFFVYPSEKHIQKKYME